MLLYTPEATVAQPKLNFLHDVKLLFNKQFSDDGVNFQGSFTLSLSLLGFTHSIEISQLLWARDENGGAAYIHLTCPAKNGQNWRVN